ncbi:MAG: hypothetical protein AAGJ91_17425, partial [Pseudomonadota bacterium]
ADKSAAGRSLPYLGQIAHSAGQQPRRPPNKTARRGGRRADPHLSAEKSRLALLTPGEVRVHRLAGSGTRIYRLHSVM